MELPRMSALAECGWTPQSMRDYKDFSGKNAGPSGVCICAATITYRHMADVDARLTTDHDARKVIAELVRQSAQPQYIIYYRRFRAYRF